MRRHLAVVLALIAAAGVALGSQQTASASPGTISPLATGYNSHAVTVTFTSDESPVTAAVSAPAGGTATLSLVACFSASSGNCLPFVTDTDGSAAGFSSGSIAGLDIDGLASPLPMTFAVALTCSVSSSAAFSASQDGQTVTASLACGDLTLVPPAGYPYPYYGYYPYPNFNTCPYFNYFAYSGNVTDLSAFTSLYNVSSLAGYSYAPGYPYTAGYPYLAGNPYYSGYQLLTLCYALDAADQWRILPGQNAIPVGNTLVPVIRNKGAGFAAVVGASSGTARNLARQYANDLATYAAQQAAALAAIIPPSTGEGAVAPPCDDPSVCE